MAETRSSSAGTPTLLEAALGYRSPALVALLILVPLAAWLWVVELARDMNGPMNGASAWMMTVAWDGRRLLLLWTMWAVMMVGMMLPAATPLLLFYGVAARRHQSGGGASRIYALAAGYVLAWALFSVLATAMQRGLGTLLLMSPMMVVTSRVAGAVFLLLAGIYQLTPLKLACLRTCQSPLNFLMRHWRTGTGGALRMGLEHGLYCVGCCWTLMLLLFAGGVMNLVVIAALTGFVAFEKLTPFGVRGARISGVLLIVVAGWMILQ